MVRAVSLLTIALLVLSACGGGAAPASAATPAAGAAAGGDITVQGFSFRPASLEVKVGSRVTWTNQDGTSHTTTSGTPGAKDGKWEGQLAGSGGTFSFTFTQAGTFAYCCAIHGAPMIGTVVVK